MGVLRLFRYYLNKYKDFYIPLKQSSDVKRGNDVFLIDLNAIFHPCCREVFTPERRLLRPSAPKPLDELKLKAFNNITSRIETLVKVANVRRVIYLAIDGVAGCCKQSQQRKRRFMGARERSKVNTAFDFANITCGTAFMKELNDFILEWAKEKRKTDWKYLRIIFNGVDVPGEGEHKLVRWISNNKKRFKSWCIYSPDADLLMLGLLLDVTSLSILKDNIYSDIKAEFLLVLIDRLKACVLSEMSYVEFAQLEHNVPDSWDNDRVIKDYVMFLFMLGNDFLPTVSSLDIASSGIDVLVKAYCETITTKGYLLSTVNTLNKDSFLELIKKMALLEPYLIVQKYISVKTLTPDLLVRKYLDFSENTPTLDFDNYRVEYYQQKLNFQSQEAQEGEKINRLCEEYLEGIHFVIQYYSVGIPTYKWFFNYHYAPLFSDLAKYIDGSKQDLEFKWVFHKPLHQLENLISVLAPSSFDILPLEIREHMKTRAQMDSDFSEDFKVDYEGKKEDYEGIPLINSLEYDKAKMILKKFKLKEVKGYEVEV
jgi:5'-3' exonuclease